MTKEKILLVAFMGVVTLAAFVFTVVMSNRDIYIQVPKGYSSPAEYAADLAVSHESVVDDMEASVERFNRVGALYYVTDEERFAVHRQLSQIRMQILASRIECHTYVLELQSLSESMSTPIDVPSASTCNVFLPEGSNETLQTE